MKLRINRGKREREEKEYVKDIESLEREPTEIYDELKKLFSKLPAIGGSILSVLTEKGINIPKMFIQITSAVLREEIRAFLNSIDVVGIMKRVLLDTAVELRIEVAFKDKSGEKESEGKKLKKGSIRISKKRKI